MDNKKNILELLKDLNNAIDRATEKIKTLEAENLKLRCCENCKNKGLKCKYTLRMNDINDFVRQNTDLFCIMYDKWESK